MDKIASQRSTESEKSAFSFISRGWDGFRDSADADLQLMRSRAKSFKNLANSFDLENLINSASTSFSVRSSSMAATDMDFMKNLQPRISEFRRVYSAPEIGKRVMQKWVAPGARLGIDLSRMRSAMLAEETEEDRGESKRARRSGLRLWKEEGSEWQFGEFREWEPIRVLKRRFKELEKSEFVEKFGGLKNSDFVEKLKASLKSIHKEPEESKVGSLIHINSGYDIQFLVSRVAII